MPPFWLESLQFAYAGSPAIPLRDHVTDEFLHVTPEWQVGGRSELVAYARGSTPVVRAIFRGPPDTTAQADIGALGPLAVAAQPATLLFDSTGLSQPLAVSFASPLPDSIGTHTVTLDWEAADPSDASIRQSLGMSSHTVCTTWKTVTPRPLPGLTPWIYSRVMEWTCRWASGCQDEKDICDAIIRNLPTSGLRYGVPWRIGPAHPVREVLQRDGGMCGQWYHVFQHMAHAHGVFVHCRSFSVDWRTTASGEVMWCAIVISNGGLNQTEPTHLRTTFHDHDGPFPDPACPLIPRTEHR